MRIPTGTDLAHFASQTEAVDLRDRSKLGWRRREAKARADARGRRRGQIRTDLERRGVAREFSGPVAERLATIASDLSPQAYAAVLQSVAAAYGVHRDDLQTLGHRTADVDQIQRLMRGFAGELRKLEEGLRILNAYVARMRTRASSEGPRTLH